MRVGSEQSGQFPCALKCGEGLIDMAHGVFGCHRNADPTSLVRNGRGPNRWNIHTLYEQMLGKGERSLGIADENRHNRTDAGRQAESQSSQSCEKPFTVTPQACTPLWLSLYDPKCCCDGSGRTWWRCRGENEGPTRVYQIADQC